MVDSCTIVLVVASPLIIFKFKMRGYIADFSVKKEFMNDINLID